MGWQAGVFLSKLCGKITVKVRGFFLVLGRLVMTRGHDDCSGAFPHAFP
jgi:hypothetical protein